MTYSCKDSNNKDDFLEKDDLLFLVLVVFLSFTCAIIESLALLRNFTIDDEHGDQLTSALSVYLPDGAWALGSTCSSCWAKPDSSMALDNT